MAQESYADFSIIQKYLEQKRHHDEEAIKHKDKIAELGDIINALRDESNAKDQAISQLNNQLEEGKSQLKEKEKNLQELSIQLRRFKKQIEQPQLETKEQVSEEHMNKKAKFGFFKK